MKKLLYPFLPLVFVLSCSNEKVETVQMLSSPADDNSSLPRLVTSPDGDVYLSWVEKKAEKMSHLMYSKLSNETWESPSQVAEGDNWFVNWADFPSLLVNGNQMAAHWLQKSDLGTYDYDVRVSFSNDNGETWGESIIPHKDQVAAEHGFVSMLPMDDGHTFMTWLDGRNTKTEGGAMTLRAGIFDHAGETIAEWELDDRICDCCQTGAAMTSNGPVVVYRDRSAGEIRDISIVRLVGRNWTTPQSIAIDLWEIHGCPVNGPAISANGDQVAVAWFTAKGDTPKVKIAFSNDSGESFSSPTLVSQGITNGRVGIDRLDNGTIIVSWMETRNDKAQIMIGNYDSSGMLLKKIEVAETSAERASGFPVITISGNDIYMAWTEVKEKTVVKTAKINL